ncbi:PucR family transcriptional regulator [Streptacidiphilus monticola]
MRGGRPARPGACGHPAGAAGEAERTGLLAAELPRLRAAGLRGSAVSSGPWGEVRAVPLGLDTLLGFLLVGGERPPDAYERTLTATAACLLSLDAERRAAQERTDREARVAAFRRLLVDDPSPEQARALLRSLRVPDPDRLQVAVAWCPGGAATAVERLASALPEVTACTDPARPEEAVLLLSGPTPEAVADEMGADVRLGVSAPVAAASGTAALRQARYALGVGRRTGVRVSGAADAGSAALLLSLGEPAALAGFADAVLDPLADALEQGRALPTLRAFLDANGAWEVAAADLGVHRHTLRHRIRRIEEVTGRDLSSAAERMDLLLAFAARDLAASGD